MKKLKKYRIRKCSDINLDSAIFEVLDENDNILMDITELDGNLEILFHESISDITIDYNYFNLIIDDAKKQVSQDK